MRECQEFAASLDCLWFCDKACIHLDGFANKQNARSWASEHPHRIVETSRMLIVIVSIFSAVS